MAVQKNWKKPKGINAVLVFFVLFSLTFLLWDFSKKGERGQIEQELALAADRLRIEIQNHVSNQILSLTQLKNFFHSKPPASEQELIGYFNTIVGGTKGLQAVSWYQRAAETWLSASVPDSSPDTIERLLESSGFLMSAKDRFIGKEKARVSKVMTIGPQKLFFVFIPLTVSEGGEGLLIGLFDVTQLLNPFSRSNSDFRFSYLVSESLRPIFPPHYTENDVVRYRPYRMVREVRVLDRSLGLVLWPSPDFLKIRSNPFGFVILGMGLLLSISSACLIHSLETRADYLQKAVDERTRDLASANKELIRKNDEIENFVYTISHDLKAPIVSIQGFAGVLEEDFGKLLPEEAKGYLKRIVANTGQMHDLIADLLELSRIGRVEEPKEQVDLGFLVDEVLEEFKPMISEKRIKVDVQRPLPRIFATRRRVRQIYANLIGNAIKYIGRPAEAHITVGLLDAKVDSGNGAFYTLFVRDNGLGIPPEFMNRIFMIFQRAHANSGIEGTGIGLSIVKKIVEKSGGKIWVESKVNEGSTFYFSLPLLLQSSGVAVPIQKGSEVTAHGG